MANPVYVKLACSKIISTPDTIWGTSSNSPMASLDGVAFSRAVVSTSGNGFFAIPLRYIEFGASWSDATWLDWCMLEPCDPAAFATAVNSMSFGTPGTSSGIWMVIEPLPWAPDDNSIISKIDTGNGNDIVIQGVVNAGNPDGNNSDYGLAGVTVFINNTPIHMKRGNLPTSIAGRSANGFSAPLKGISLTRSNGTYAQMSPYSHYQPMQDNDPIDLEAWSSIYDWYKTGIYGWETTLSIFDTMDDDFADSGLPTNYHVTQALTIRYTLVYRSGVGISRRVIQRLIPQTWTINGTGDYSHPSQAIRLAVGNNLQFAGLAVDATTETRWTSSTFFPESGTPSSSQQANMASILRDHLGIIEADSPQLYWCAVYSSGSGSLPVLFHIFTSDELGGISSSTSTMGGLQSVSLMSGYAFDVGKFGWLAGTDTPPNAWGTGGHVTLNGRMLQSFRSLKIEAYTSSVSTTYAPKWNSDGTGIYVPRWILSSWDRGGDAYFIPLTGTITKANTEILYLDSPTVVPYGEARMPGTLRLFVRYLITQGVGSLNQGIMTKAQPTAIGGYNKAERIVFTISGASRVPFGRVSPSWTASTQKMESAALSGKMIEREGDLIAGVAQYVKSASTGRIAIPYYGDGTGIDGSVTIGGSNSTLPKSVHLRNRRWLSNLNDYYASAYFKYDLSTEIQREYYFRISYTQHPIGVVQTPISISTLSSSAANTRMGSIAPPAVTEPAVVINMDPSNTRNVIPSGNYGIPVRVTISKPESGTTITTKVEVSSNLATSGGSSSFPTSWTELGTFTGTTGDIGAIMFRTDLNKDKQQLKRDTHTSYIITEHGINNLDTTINLTDDTFSIPQNSTSYLDVLANDDPGSELVSIEVNPTQGVATINYGWVDTIQYVPNDNTYAGPDSLTYRAKDAAGNEATANVNITLLEVDQEINTAPDDYTIPFEQSTFLNVVDNDDPDVFVGALSTPPLHGTATIRWDKRGIDYLPDAGYEGPDSLSYRGEDAAGNTLVTAVTLTVLPHTVVPVGSRTYQLDKTNYEVSASNRVGTAVRPSKIYIKIPEGSAKDDAYFFGSVEAVVSVPTGWVYTPGFIGALQAIRVVYTSGELLTPFQALTPYSTGITVQCATATGKIIAAKVWWKVDGGEESQSLYVESSTITTANASVQPAHSTWLSAMGDPDASAYCSTITIYGKTGTTDTIDDLPADNAFFYDTGMDKFLAIPVKQLWLEPAAVAANNHIVGFGFPITYALPVASGDTQVARLIHEIGKDIADVPYEAGVFIITRPTYWTAQVHIPNTTGGYVSSPISVDLGTIYAETSGVGLGDNCSFPVPIGPRTYDVFSENGIRIYTDSTDNTWDFTYPKSTYIRVPSSISYNDADKKGFTITKLAPLNNDSDRDVYTADIQELLTLNVVYGSDASTITTPAELPTNSQALILMYNQAGSLVGGKYYMRQLDGITVMDVDPISSANDGSVSVPQAVLLPASSLSWYNPWLLSEDNGCTWGEIVPAVSGASNSGTFERDKFYVSITGNVVNVVCSLARFLNSASQNKQSMVHLRFTDMGTMNIADYDGIMFMDANVSPLSAFSLDTTLVITRTADTDTFRLHRHDAFAVGGWVSSPVSIPYRLWDEVTTGLWTNVWPSCPNEIWNGNSVWEVRHADSPPPISGLNPGDYPVVWVEHINQYDKRLFIPEALVYTRVNKTGYYFYPFSIDPADDILSLPSMLARMKQLSFVPDGSVSDATKFFNLANRGTAKVGLSIMDNDNHTNPVVQLTQVVRDEAGIGHRNPITATVSLATNYYITDDVDSRGGHGTEYWQYYDWINQSVVVDHHNMDIGIITDSIGSRDNVHIFKSGLDYKIVLPTADTFREEDRHLEQFSVTLTAEIAAKLDATTEVCVWCDSDTKAVVIGSLGSFIADSFAIVRDSEKLLRMYYVKAAPIAGQPNTVFSYILNYEGYLYNGNDPGMSNAWGLSNCDKYDLNMLWYGGRRKLPIVNTIAKTNEIEMSYDPASSTLRIHLCDGLTTGLERDKNKRTLTYLLVSRFGFMWDNLDFIMVDPRGIVDNSLNSELYNSPADFEVGDMEIVLVRDKNTNLMTLNVVEKRGDGVSVIETFNPLSIGSTSGALISEIPETELFYVYPRTDEQHGGLITTEELPADAVRWSDSVYITKRPYGSNLPTQVRLEFTTSILTTLSDKQNAWRYIDLPYTDFISFYEDVLARPYVCFNSDYYPSNISTELPQNAIEGSMVVSKLTSVKVRVFVFSAGVWQCLGDHYVSDLGQDIHAGETYSYPPCSSFLVTQPCVMGFVPDTSESTELVPTWLDNGETNWVAVGEFVGYNRIGAVSTGLPIPMNLYSPFHLPPEMRADSVRIDFVRKPEGNLGYVTSAKLDATTRFFVFITDAQPDNINFDDIIPKVPAGNELYAIALSVRDIPTPTFHDTDGTVLDMELVTPLTTMTYDPTDLTHIVDGTHNITIVCVKQGKKMSLWLYDKGVLVGRTKDGIDIPWFASGTIGLHSHSMSDGLYSERITQLKISHGPLRYDCMPMGTLTPNPGCEAAPDTMTQSIHTPVLDNNIETEIYRPLAGTSVAYLHIDIINNGTDDALVSILRKNTDGTTTVLRGPKRITKDQRFEMHYPRAQAGQIWYGKVTRGEVSIRVSSIEETY